RSSVESLSVDRTDLQRLALIRVRECKALLNLELNDGAYYLAGYAVECALKACIAKRTLRHEFPEKKRVDASHTHDVAALVKISGLDDALRAELKKDLMFWKNW